MKNLNVKPYPAYHPYQRHNSQQQQRQQQESPQYQPHSQQQQLPNHNSSPSSLTPAPLTAASNSHRYTNNAQTTVPAGSVGGSVSCIAATSSSPAAAQQPVTTAPPTLGGYLANQQLQQQLRLPLHSYQRQQSLTSPLTPSHLNMLSLTQNNAYNYNFNFNMACGGSGVGQPPNECHGSNNLASRNPNGSHNLSPKTPYSHNAQAHGSAPLSRPQRPNSLNIPAMASLATPPPLSGSAYVNGPATAHSCGSAPMLNAGAATGVGPNGSGSGSFPHFYQPRENVFNFNSSNAHNYLQQSFYNYNNMQQQQQMQQKQQLQQQLQQQQQKQQFQQQQKQQLQQQQEQQQHQHLQQLQQQQRMQQHHLQQFQLLQQQLKQQQQQQQQQHQPQLPQQQISSICNMNAAPIKTAPSRLLTPPVSASQDAANNLVCNPSQNSNNSNNVANAAAMLPIITSGHNNAMNTYFTNSNSNNNNNNSNANNNNNNNKNDSNNCDRLPMDASEIANFLANELFMQQLVEGMQTGVPTLTTPTLTPTTLRSIEDTFIQLVSEQPNVPYQAGFIPPPLASYNATTTNTNATTIVTSNVNSTTAGGLNSNNNNNSGNNVNVNNNSNSNILSNAAANAVLNNVYLGDISASASLQDYGNLNDSETEENSQESWNDQNLHEDNSMGTTDNSSAATDTTSFQNGLNGMGVSNLNNSNSSTANDFSAVLAVRTLAAAAAKMSSNSAKLNSNTSLSATHNNSVSTATPRRGGGRRPTTNTNMTPEEEEKRRIRRERNKLAAARCRKRRVDQTNELTDEVHLLEKKREELQKQIEELNETKQELEFIIESHRPTCQRMAQDILSVNSFAGLGLAAGDNDGGNITGMDSTLASTARSNSPLDLKPVLNDQLLSHIKDEPVDSTLDSNSSLDGPPSPKKLLLSGNNPMIPPPLPNVATLSPSLAAASASLNTPIVTTAPINFNSVFTANPMLTKPNSKQRPNTLPTVPRNQAQNLGLNIADNKPPTDINGVAIQTPSTGMFNFDSLMDGGTGLTPVSCPLVPTCSSQNKHPLELVTPTSEPSKLVSL